MSSVEYITSATLSAPAASVILGSGNTIPQSFTDLVLVVKAGTEGGMNSWIRYNGDTGTNYSATMIRSTGSSALSTRRTNEYGWLQDFQRDTAVNADIWHIEIMNYANTSVYKTGISRTQSAQWDSVISAGLWRSTAAITSITMFSSGANFSAGSTFTLWGVK